MTPFADMIEDIKRELQKSDLVDPLIMVVETEGNGPYTHDPETYEVDILLGHDIEVMKKKALEIIDERDRGWWTVHNVSLLKDMSQCEVIFDWKKGVFK